MFTIKVVDSFSGAHNLRGYEGKCEDLHGHNWKVEVEASSEVLDKTGMVIDFKIIKSKLSMILDGLDHKYLNDIDYFSDVNPTSENIARYVFEKLAGYFPGIILKKVTIWETDTSSASYERCSSE